MDTALEEQMRNVLKRIFEFVSLLCAIFSSWGMVDFVFYLRNELGTWRFLQT